MKKNDLLNEKMPSSLKARILKNADQYLEKNSHSERRSFLSWLLAAGTVVATAAISFVYVRQNNSSEHQHLELAQSIELFEDIQSDEDVDLLAELEVIEDLDLVMSIDDES